MSGTRPLASPTDQAGGSHLSSGSSGTFHVFNILMPWSPERVKDLSEVTKQNNLHTFLNSALWC